MSLPLRRTEAFELLPAGTIITYAGITLPTGRYFWADGTTRSRTLYPDLFANLTIKQTGSMVSGNANITVQSTTDMRTGMPVCGPGIQANTIISVILNATTIILSNNATTTITGDVYVCPHGVGDGISTFNLPDDRGLVSVGRDDMGGAAAGRMTGLSGIDPDRLGSIGGAEMHTLTIPQMPSHTHSATTGDGSNNAGTFFGTFLTIDGGALTTGSTGGGGAHNNTQPSVVRNKLVIY